MNYEPHTAHHWERFARNSRLPMGYFDRRPRHLGRWFLAVLLVALICVACVRP